jgi:hypothetical protein
MIRNIRKSLELIRYDFNSNGHLRVDVDIENRMARNAKQRFSPYNSVKDAQPSMSIMKSSTSDLMNGSLPIESISLKRWNGQRRKSPLIRKTVRER